MKQQISPWSIYDNFGAPKHKEVHPQNDKSIQKYTKASRVLPKTIEAKNNSKVLAQIQIQKTKLNRKINQLFIIQNIRDSLATKESYKSKNLPVLSRKVSNEQKPKAAQVQVHHHTVDNKEHHSVDNIPHFPKIERNKKIIEDRLPEFDDRSIHEKIQLIKDKKKKKFSLLELNSPSSTLL